VLLGRDGLTTADATPPGPPEVYLKPGVYLLQFVNRGEGLIHLTWTMKQKTPWDALLDNGVGQGPALNLRLVSPTSAGLSTGAPDGEEGPTAPTAPSGSPPTGPVGPTSPSTGGPTGPIGSGVTPTDPGSPASSPAPSVTVASPVHAVGTPATYLAPGG